MPVTNIGGCKWQTLCGDEAPILPLLAPVLLTKQPLRRQSAPAAASDVAENIASDEEVDGSQLDALFQVDSEVASQQAQPSCLRAGMRGRSFKTVAKAYIMGVDDNFSSESDLSDGMTSPDDDLSDADAIAIPKIAKPKKQGQKVGKTPGSASADPTAGPAAGVGDDVGVVVDEPSSSSATAPAPAPAPPPALAVGSQPEEPRRARGVASEVGHSGRRFSSLKVGRQFAGWSLECRTCGYTKSIA